MTRWSTLLLIGTALMLVHTGAALSQSYPDRTIRVVDAFPPGGSTDVPMRIVAERLTHTLGQSVIVDNRPGAGGNIGTEYVVRAAADGYTLLIGSSIIFASSTALNPNLPYNVLGGLEPIIQIGTGGHLLVVNPSLPAKTLQELIALAKSKPGQLNYSSSGVGAGGHLVAELFKSRAGIDLNHVAYRGGAPALLGILSGDVQLGFVSITAGVPHVKSGKLRALGVSSSTPSPLMPDVPPIAKTLPGFEVVASYGIYAPKGTPPYIILRLNEEIRKVLAQEDTRERLAAIGIDAAPTSPQELAVILREEMVKWARVIQDAGIKLQ